MTKKKTTIQIDEDVKKELDKLAIHRREPYNDILRRLIEFYKKNIKQT